MMTACLVLKKKIVWHIKSAFRGLSKKILYSPCNVGHRIVSPDSVIKALSVVWNMIKIPDCLAWLGHITVPHLWDDFAPHYLVPIRLQHQVATGYVHNLGNIYIIYAQTTKQIRE